MVNELIHQEEQQMRTVIAGDGDRHGTGTAFSRLPAGYEGPCRMSYLGRRGRRNSVVFANRAEAGLAATFAVQPDRGGYHTAELTIARTEEVTHASCIDWICSDSDSASSPAFLQGASHD